MTRTIITRENPSGELEALRHRVEELEVLEVKYRVNKSLFQLENEARYEAVFESVNDAILLVDKRGKIIDVNQRLIEFSGHTREMLVGKPVTALSKHGNPGKASAICMINFLTTNDNFQRSTIRI
jgi:PAS domain-containing protein